MATCQQLRDGIYLISWVNPYYEPTAQSEVLLAEIDHVCELFYEVTDDELNTILTVKILPSSTLGKCNAVKATSIWASKYGTKQQMQNKNDDVWKTSFESSFFRRRDKGFIFDIVIDLIPEGMIVVKKESKDVIDHLLDLWITRTQADVTFRLEGNVEIKAHSQILAARSPLLAATYHQGALENGEERVAIIKNIKPEVFDKLLRFIYTGDADLDEATCCEILVAAETFGIEPLKEECALYLPNFLTVDNAVRILTVSHLYNLRRLRLSTINFMKKNAKEICSRQEWLEFIRKYPEESFFAMSIMV